MKKEKERIFSKAIIVVFIFVASFLIAGGWTTYYSPKANAFFGINIGVATPNFAFTIGNGINTYEAPALGGYVYGYNGDYLRWMGSYWVYAPSFGGPWNPLPYGFYLPPSLVYGPPPPYYNNGPYYQWWVGHVSPWWHANYPGWWARHGRYMRNYNEWNNHVEHFYHRRPGPGFRRFNGAGRRPQQGPGRRQNQGPGPQQGHHHRDQYHGQGPQQGPGR